MEDLSFILPIYIVSLIIIPFILTFPISIILFIFAKKILKKLQFGQVVRDDGPETHIKKSGTPTMAGIVFLIIFLITFVTFKILNIKNFNNEYQIITFSILYGVIGFIDDYLKVSKKNTKGLKSIIKFMLQIVLAYTYIIICINNKISHNIIYILFLIFIIVGTDNGVNFTDGLDGLCTMVTAIISIFYAFISFTSGCIELTAINIIVFAMLMAFLVFNHYPAKLFMGDTGSLFLGAFVSFMAIELKIEYLLPIYGFIYMIEVLSVIIQVSYFKISGGKRIFKMAPIHHHFEKCGFSEVKVVTLFSITTIILCIITLFIAKISI